VDDRNGPDRVLFVLRELFPDDRRINAMPPVPGKEVDLQTEFRRQISP